MKHILEYLYFHCLFLQVMRVDSSVSFSSLRETEEGKARHRVTGGLHMITPIQ